MDIKTTVTANLNIEDVKKILTEKMEKQMPGHTVQRIDFRVSNTSEDYFGGGYPRHDLTGVDVVMIPKRTEF